MTGAVFVPPVGSDDLAAAAPLAADLFLEVGPFVVPVTALASRAFVEAKDSETGAATREFLREDPWAGMGSVRPGGWVLLARDDDTFMIGRRRGEVGLRAVVTLVRAGDRFEATAMGGARLSTGVPHERVQAISGVSADARSLVLDWDCGADLRGNPLRRVARILTAFTADAIHLLLVSEPAENGLTRGAGLELGTGWAAHSPLLLDEDPADRRLLTDHCIPAEQIPR